ncbi:YegP family protein [Streptomyces sp. NPDC002773]|uniref:YegP family protein n=1 Tax=Streptomyces sp. NPDC002773 TaxID=3154430 RepID=UPI003319DF60
MTKDTGVSGTRCLVDVGADGRYGWRLVAQNGRVVARSGGCYDDHAGCRDAFAALCAGHAELAGGVQHTADGNGWVWLLRDAEGRPAALSGRSYERHSTLPYRLCAIPCPDRRRRPQAGLNSLTVNGSCPAHAPRSHRVAHPATGPDLCPSRDDRDDRDA